MLACCLGQLSQQHIYGCWHVLFVPMVAISVLPTNCSCKSSTQEEKPKTSTYTLEDKSYEQQVEMGEKQVTVGEDMPDGWHLKEKIKQFFSGENDSEVMEVCTFI